MILHPNCPEIAEFLEHARKEAEQSGEICQIPTFQEFWEQKYAANEIQFNSHAFLNDMSVLLAHRELDYYQELTSYHSGIAGLVRPVKRVIRKLNAFLFLPLVHAQNNCNLVVSRLFLHLRSYVNREEYERKRTQQRMQELEQQLLAQQETIRLLSEEIEALRAHLRDGGNGQP